VSTIRGANLPPDDIEFGARAAIQLLDSKIGALIVERDNLVVAIEAARANARVMEEKKEELERRIEELRKTSGENGEGNEGRVWNRSAVSLSLRNLG
jgi:DUF1009 family protein